MVADLRWGGADIAEAGSDVGMDAPPPVRWHIVEERVADQSVAESVAGGGTFDDIRSKGRIKMVERLSFVEAAEGDECVGVEGGADDGDALEELTGDGRDAPDHVDID